VEGVALAWTTRGDRLAVADGAESVRVFDTKDGVELPRLVTPRAGAGQLAWSQDGNLLAVAGRRGGIRVYDPASGELRLGVGADDWQYTPFAWRPGADALALDENGVRVVALEARGEHRTVARRLGRVVGLGFRSGNVLALDTEGTLHRLSLDGREVAREAGVRRLASISPDGRHALRHLGATSEVWALEGRPERRFSLSGGFHAWRRDGLVLATAGIQDISLWDVPSGERKARIAAPESPSLALSPDGRWLARASLEPARSMSVVLHDLAKGGTRALVPPTAATFRGLAFSPDGAHLAFLEQPHSAPESRLRIHETDSGAERTLALPASGVNPALLWGDARTIVVMAGRVVRLVDAATGDVRLEFRVADAGSPSTPALAGSEDGAWIAAGVSDVDVYDWKALLGIAGATPADLLAEAERRTGLRVEDDRLVPR
ncbi:MAG TPA: hypothetical protein VFF73_12750, partial [Planctomycetota bacterium]|nr:hypothetical protein [Planctomycetota bacterium]